MLSESVKLQIEKKFGERIRNQTALGSELSQILVEFIRKRTSLGLDVDYKPFKNRTRQYLKAKRNVLSGRWKSKHYSRNKDSVYQAKANSNWLRFSGQLYNNLQVITKKIDFPLLSKKATFVFSLGFRKELDYFKYVNKERKFLGLKVLPATLEKEIKEVIRKYVK